MHKPHKILAVFLSSLLTLLATMLVMLASVPPTSRDALTHHLAVPKLYLQHGGMYEIPWLEFSYYPMNLDLLYMIPLAFGNDIIPKYLHFSFALGTALLVFFYLKSRINMVSGLFGALFFLSIPVITKLSFTIYVDLGLIFFTTASLLLIFRWLSSGYKTSFLIYAGIFCGLAAGTKYNGLITCLLLTSFIPILYIRFHSEGIKEPKLNLKAMRYGLLFLGIILIVFSPWAIRNYLWTSNPLYPMFHSFFGDAPALAPALEITSLTLRKLLYNESTFQVMLLPFRMFYEGKDNIPQFFDGQLSIFLLLLPPCAFFNIHKSGKLERLEKITMLVFCILFLSLALFLAGARVRYISPIVPFLVILSCYGICNISIFIERLPWRHSKLWSRIAPTVIIIAILSFNGRYLIDQFNSVQPLGYLDGSVPRDEYITRYRSEYPTVLYANQHLPSDSKILCLFLGNRGYYMDFYHRFSTPEKPDDDLKKLLFPKTQARNQPLTYTHLLIRDDLMTFWMNNLNRNERITVQSFFNNNAKQLYSKNGYSLFEI